MKIAFLLTQLEVGGAQVRVMQTAAELRSRGHVVDVIFLYRKRDAFADDEKIVLSDKGGATGILGAVLKLPGVLRRGHYDALVTNTAPANIIGNSVAAAIGLKKRAACQTQPPERLNSVYRFLDRVVGTIGVYRYNIANSGWTRSCFKSYPASYQSHMHTITNGIAPRVSELSREQARAEFGWPIDEKIVLNIGRLSRQKGHDTLIRAFAEVSDARLVLVGDGELREDLQELARTLKIEDRVQFVGEVPGDKIAKLLRASDLFVFPSRWETFGLAVVEAAASGLPIVASDLDVLEEVLSTPNGEPAAIFVPVDDVTGFANKTREMISSLEMSDDYSKRSLAVAGQHTMGKHADKLLAALNSL